MVNTKIIRILFVLLLYTVPIWAQQQGDRFQQLEQKLDAFAKDNPEVDELIDIAITGNLKEFAIAFAKETKVNLTIDPSIDQRVVTNFSDTRPRDILLHLCKFYQLDLSLSGSIISIIPYKAPLMAPPPRLIDITYNNYNDRLQLNLNQDTLDQVAKKISELSQKNVICDIEASELLVSGFVGNAPFEDALEQMAKRNRLKITKDDKGYYLIEPLKPDPQTTTAATGATNTRGRTSSRRGAKTPPRPSVGNLQIEYKATGGGSKKLKVDAANVGLADVIKEVSLETGANYFLFAEPTEKISLKIEDADYEGFLQSALQGSKFTYKKDGNLYLIGDLTTNALKETQVYQLQHRSVKDLLQYIPQELLTDVEAQEFIQLNSIVLSGTEEGMQRVTDFLLEIDRAVPVVMIELMILDVQNSKTFEAGVEAGIATEPVQPGGLIYPEANFTFSAKAINNLLSTIAGNGIVNLGQVSPNFYLSLQAVETNGFAKVRSKPRLSTLNGLEASLSLGETRYFLNERTTLQGNQNPVSLQDRRFEAVNADFSIRIVPIVSGDEHVTLEIEVNQSDFIGQVQTNAPPPQVNRTFNSNIRILNREMIVLGGLESKTLEESGTGVPFLSRIPIIKWLFSRRRRSNNKSKLLIFVRPTVIY